MTPGDGLVSVVINNYNYGRFLDAAIQSALAQTYRPVEVIVVDDGSTDESRSVIARYTGRVTPIIKTNGGQASAFNAGFAASRGDVIIFLDADDMLSDAAVGEVMARFGDSDVVKVHWPLWEIDACGCRTGRLVPDRTLPEGNLRDLALAEGPASHLNPPTSGNAWSGVYLRRIFPVPEGEYRIWADVYLQELSPLFGTMKRLPSPQGFYRVHGANRYASRSFAERLRHGVAVYDHVCEAMSRFAADCGLSADIARLRRGSWYHRLAATTRALADAIPMGSTVVVADNAEWGLDDSFLRVRWLPFLERDGEYWGLPPDDETAIRELERLRDDGAMYFILGWPAFWWREYYVAFADYLSKRFHCLVDDDLLAVFALGNDRCRAGESDVGNRAS